MSKFLVIDTHGEDSNPLPYSVCSISNNRKTAMAYINRKNNKQEIKDIYIIAEVIKYEIIQLEFKLENYNNKLILE